MKLKTFIKALKRDLKERFATFETAKGVFLVPAGAVVTYAAIFHVSFVIQTTFAAGGIYAVVEGLRKITVNRVKQSLAHERLKQTHLAETHEPTVAAKVPAPEVKA